MDPVFSKIQQGVWTVWMILALLLYFRLNEFILLNHLHDVPDLASKEWSGSFKDIMLASPLIFFLIIVYFIGNKSLDLIISLIVGCYSILNVLILQYFFYGLRPLDTFVYNYPKKEIFSAISSSNQSVVLVFIQFLLPILLVLYFKKKRIFFNSILNVKWILILSLIGISCLIVYKGKFFKHQISMNKSVFFFRNSFYYFLNESDELTNMVGIGSQYQTIFPRPDYISSSYPLLHKMDTSNNMGKYFIHSDKTPNICILIIEGLGDKFISNYKGINLMPFLDSLKFQSLYWDRFFTVGERSFAAVPSLTGSLPYGERGFMFLDQLPLHHTLMNVLNPNHYSSTYFIGQGAWFHNTDALFKYSNAKCIFDKDSFDQRFQKIIVGQDKFFWGYNDKDLFEQSIQVVKKQGFNTRLDVYFTGSSHAPFQIADESTYRQRFMDLIPVNSPYKLHFEKYEKQYLSLMFLDDALRNFIYAYQNLPEFNNTIFILTGDHPMTEIPIENSLWRYHVPLLMYSPLLKHPQTFHEVASHLDLYETLLSYLNREYAINIPNYSAALGHKLLFEASYNDDKTIAFMNDNREIIDLFDNGKFLSNKSQLAKVDSSFNLIPFDDVVVKDSMINKLSCFQLMCRYTCQFNKILPPKDYFNGIGKNDFKVIFNDSKNVSNDEFVGLSKDIDVSNQSILIQLDLELSNVMNSSCLFVVQAVDSKDSTLYWEGLQMKPGETRQTFSVKIPSLPVQLGSNKLKLYLWNKDKLPCGYNHLDIKLYQ